MRSFLFNCTFYFMTLVIAILCIPLLILPGRRPLVVMLHFWAKHMVWLMSSIAGIKVEFRGKENMPGEGPALLAGKHQSYSDGILVLSQVQDIAVVAMKELLAFPIVGRVLKKLEMIMVDCGGGPRPQIDLKERGEMAFNRGRPILIYPEGQLVKVGEKATYKTGIFYLYDHLGLPVTPIATNIGLRWSKRAWKKIPGPAVVEFLPAIPTGLGRHEFMDRLEERIEAATERLVAEHQS